MTRQRAENRDLSSFYRILASVLCGFGVLAVAFFWDMEAALAAVPSGGGGVGANDIAGVGDTLLSNTSKTPTWISMSAYVLAIIAALSFVFGMIKYIESPQQNPMRQPLMALFASGAFFGLPSILTALRETFFGTSSDSLIVTGAAHSGTGLGQLIYRLSDNTTVIPEILSALAWISSGMLAISATIMARQHVDNPNQVPLRQVLLRYTGAGLLGALPMASQAVVTTLFPSFSSSILAPRSTGTAVSATADAATRMAAFLSNISGPLTFAVSALAYILGLIMLFQGFSRMVKYGQDAKSGPTPIITSLIIGATLLALPQMMDATLSSIFGSSSIRTYSALSSLPTGATGSATTINAVMLSVFTFLGAIGWVSFLRGLVMLRTAGDGGQASRSAAFTHIIAGAILVNFAAFVALLQSTLGVSIITTT
jgi:hypothetical protein